MATAALELIIRVLVYGRRCLMDESGVVATEYVFIIAFLCIAVAFAGIIFGQAMINYFAGLAGVTSGAMVPVSQL